jgi:hypothetical protein
MKKRMTLALACLLGTACGVSMHAQPIAAAAVDADDFAYSGDKGLGFWPEQTLLNDGGHIVYSASNLARLRDEVSAGLRLRNSRLNVDVRVLSRGPVMGFESALLASSSQNLITRCESPLLVANC